MLGLRFARFTGAAAAALTAAEIALSIGNGVFRLTAAKGGGPRGRDSLPRDLGGPGGIIPPGGRWDTLPP